MKAVLDVSIDEAPLVFLDCETTGLDAFHGDRVCEFALVRVENGVVTKSFETLIDPERQVSLGAYFVNRISHHMLEGKPRFIEVIPEIMEGVRSAVVVGHNVSFDLMFLREEFRRAGITLSFPATIDTLKLARWMYSFPSFTLSQVATFLGLAVPAGQPDSDRRPHRAMADVAILKDVFDAMTAELRQREGILRIGELIRIAGHIH
ncbi:MAG: 3'-5' exonuclease [Elusimicrobia bacterium]|nr:3'-5' exonuclease [Elusimicrobiota bacterium]